MVFKRFSAQKPNLLVLVSRLAADVSKVAPAIMVTFRTVKLYSYFGEREGLLLLLLFF